MSFASSKRLIVNLATFGKAGKAGINPLNSFLCSG